MNTLAAILAMILLLALCGTGPSLLLLPRDASGRRVLLCPILGLCSGILFANALASAGLTGRTIAILSLAFFGALATFAVYRNRFSRKEWGGACPSLLIAAAGLALVGWPLLQAGHRLYWGFANPDVPFYLGMLEHLDRNRFSIPGPDEYNGFYRGVNPSTILGISYFFSMLRLVSGVPIVFLFGVAAAAMLFLAPGATFLWAMAGLGGKRSAALIAAATISCSSLVAYTFYLQSLGALTVIVLFPAGLALVSSYMDGSPGDHPLSVSLIAAGLYYCYYPGFAILALAAGFVVLDALRRRAVPVRRILIPAGLTVALILIVHLPQARAIVTSLFLEASSSRLASDSQSEIPAFFGFALTEQYVPFFWGLKAPSLTSPFDSWILFGIGCALSALLLLSVWRQPSRTSPAYAPVLVSIIAIVAVYTAGRNGYGVFKLAAWVHPVVVVGLVVSIFGAADALRGRLPRPMSLMPFLALLLYLGINARQTFRLGQSSLAGTGDHNARGLTLQDFTELTEVARVAGASPVIAALPDPVVQRWAVPFLKEAHVRFFPTVDLEVTESAPPALREELRGAYLLHWRDASQEVAANPSVQAVWQNRAFALTPLETSRNTIAFGLGWYRKEQVYGSPVEWQRKFRWLRKRGAVLLLNPSGSPKRLVLRLIAGYGNSSPERHINLLLNGKKFDEIHLVGFAHVMSRPFSPPPPWSEIELQVEENAEPLPGLARLWNVWVPRDPRRLNVAVSEAALIEADREDPPIDSAVDFTSSDQFSRALVNGVYPDRQIAPEAALRLKRPPSLGVVEIRGAFHLTPGCPLPYSLQVSVDGSPLGTATVSHAGRFDIKLPLPPPPRSSSGAEVATVALRSACASSASSQPGPLPVLLERVALDPDVGQGTNHR